MAGVKPNVGQWNKEKIEEWFRKRGYTGDIPDRRLVGDEPKPVPQEPPWQSWEDFFNATHWPSAFRRPFGRPPEGEGQTPVIPPPPRSWAAQGGTRTAGAPPQVNPYAGYYAPMSMGFGASSYPPAYPPTYGARMAPALFPWWAMYRYGW